jgi:creatinine amidohydrolase
MPGAPTARSDDMPKSEQSDPFPLMENMTVSQVRKYLAKKQSVIVPLGVIEQHGYHLPLKTDALIAAHLAARIGRQTQILVAPTIAQSFSGGGLPGTINISPAVMSLLVSDTLLSLAAQGFRNFYLFLCHGGSENARALEGALKLLLRTNPTFENSMIALLPVWKFQQYPDGWARAIQEGDWHAGWLETSLVMALEPELVRMEDLRLDPQPLLEEQIAHPDNYQCAEKIVDDPFVIPRLTQRPEIEVGVMGHPGKASPEAGQEIANHIVQEVAEKIEELESKCDRCYRRVPFVPEPLILS